MKLIRDHYIAVSQLIGNEHLGKRTDIPRAEEISEDVPLGQAIGYTYKHISDVGNWSEDSQPHYRYNRYEQALRKFYCNSANKRIMHLDLGCGPGLFSWVVRDYVLKNYGKESGDIELVGYDYAPNMIRLAELFREYLPVDVEYNFEGYYELDKIQNMLESKDLSDYDCIITFGHVLVQTEGNREAMQNFIDIIRRLFPVNSCILLAVDAFGKEDSRQKFVNACEELWRYLSDVGINVRDVRAPPRERLQYDGCWMHCRLSKET